MDTNEELDLTQEPYGSILSRPVELDDLLGTELKICFNTIDAPCEIKTCYGDIKKIVDVLMDYSRLLDLTCEHEKLTAFSRAKYGCYAEKLRFIAQKYQAGIGYDYDKVLEKCQNKKKEAKTESDTGGEALEMGVRIAAQRKKAKEAANSKKNKK